MKGNLRAPDGAPLLESLIDKEMKTMWYHMLEFIEQVVTISNPNDKDKVFQPFRSKILNKGNNTLKRIKEEVRRYNITPKQVVEEVLISGGKTKDQSQGDGNGK